MSLKAGKIVYIGGIPFDYSEFDVKNIANNVGSVIGVKLVFDLLTGKSKGYAFVEYADEETAASAVRNLNNYAVGSRSLKCGFSAGSSINGTVTILNPDGSVKTIEGEGGMLSNGDGNKRRKVSTEGMGIPPLPPGVSLRDGQSVLDAVSTTLKGLNQNRLVSIINDAKAMTAKNPELMVAFLDQCPQLASTLVEIMLLFQIKTPADIGGLLSEEVTGKQEPVAAPAAQPAAQPAAEKNELPAVDPQQLEAIKQVIHLSADQIEGLPEEQKTMILQIQTDYKNGVYGTL